ncbi:MAG: leucyl aminopeptidase [Thiotrichales bacterium]|nr:MAG: leucyl aminopeptidase [Thiotrichales bacterium]
MKFNIPNDFWKQQFDCLVIGVFNNKKLAADLPKEIATAINNTLKDSIWQPEFAGSMLVHLENFKISKQILLIGCGDDNKLTPYKYDKLLKASCKTITKLTVKTIGNTLNTLHVKTLNETDCTKLASIAMQCAPYTGDFLKKDSKANKQPAEQTISFTSSKKLIYDNQRAITQGQKIGQGINFARKLGDLPGNMCTPTYLANSALELAKQYKLTATILGEKELQQEKMHSLLAVGQGSRQESKLIVLEYTGATKKSLNPVVIVGKGITFDAGGINLKPSHALMTWPMKMDMCGAAAALAIMQAVAALALPINLTIVIPSAENMPDGNAYKPFDVVSGLSGTTIEIINTDAEGRIVLSDALSYSQKFNPAMIIDIATLTGAICVALGKQYVGIYSNHQPIVEDIINAGNKINELAWHMPIHAEAYEEMMKSDIADIKNIGSITGEAGSNTAAYFLSKFIGKHRWLHMDVAATAIDKQATGSPVALVMQYLLDLAKKIQQPK